MGCNCEPKNYNIKMGCCQPVLGPIEQYYTKYQIDKMLEEIESGITSGCCITPEEVDEKIESAKTEIESEIPSLSGYATEQWVLDKHYISGVDLSDYALKSEIPTVPTSNSAFTNDMGYLTEHQPIKTINGQSLIGTGDIEIGTGGTIDLSNYYTTAETVNLVESAVTVVESEIPSLSGYATEQWVLDKHYISGVDLSDYALKSEIPTVPTSNTAFTNDAGYITGVDLSNYATLQDIPTVPTSNTAFTNDAGYLTEHQSLSAYSTTNEVNTMINQATSGLQETLVAGANITISGNTISANCCPTIWCGTEQQWASISGNPDSNTIYLIHE